MLKMMGKKKNGFTLIEFLIAFAIAAIIIPGVITLYMNANSANRNLANRTDAVNQLKNIVNYITSDTQMAGFVATATGNSFPLTLSWTVYPSSQTTVTYTLLSDGTLQRNQYLNNVLQSSMILATDVAANTAQTPTGVNWNDQVLKVTITISIGNIIQTQSFYITPRVIQAAITRSPSNVYVSSSPQTVAYGQQVTFTATVTPGAATGSVVFQDSYNGNPAVPLNAGGSSLNSSAQTTYQTSTLLTGTHIITAVYSGDTVYSNSTSPTGTLTVVTSVTAGLADASKSTLTPTAANEVVGTHTTVLTVTAKDSTGAPVTTGGATVTIVNAVGTGTIGPVTDNNNGTYTATVTAPATVGSGVFIATLGGQSVESGSGSQTQATVTYTAGQVSAAKSTLTPTSSSVALNESNNTQVLTVTAIDVNGNPVPVGGESVVIFLSSGTGTIGGVTDNGDGTYTATVTAPITVGSGVFEATLDGQPVQSGTASQTQATVNYYLGTPSAAQSTLTPTSASILANGASTQVLTVTAKDANGNTLNTGGATVTITLLSGTGTIGAVSYNGNGTYIATVTAPSASGSGVFVATLNGQPVDSGTTTQTQSTIHYLGSANAAKSTLTPTSANISANVGSSTSSTVVLTVTAMDVSGNTLTSGGATVTITKLSGSGTISAVADKGNGTYQATVTAPITTDSGIFVATLNGSTVNSGTGSQTQATIYYVGPANAAKSTLTIVPPSTASIVANGTNTTVLTVTARDANGIALSNGGATVTITELSGTGTISFVTDNNNGTYSATVTAPTTAGTGVFVATLNGATVNGGTAGQTQLTVTYTVGQANATMSTLTPLSASITGNGSSTVVLTVTARDANGNALTGGGATVVISRLSGTGTITQAHDNGDGTYTSTVTSPNGAGSGVFVATLGGSAVNNGTGTQAQAIVTYAGTASASQSTLTPLQSSILAVGGTQILIVTAKDASGNNLSTGGATVTITLKSGGTASPHGTISTPVTDNHNGTYTATVTAPGVTGYDYFVATLNGATVNSGSGSQTQVTVNYTAGIASAKYTTLTPTSATEVVGTGTTTLTVTAYDANNMKLTTGGGAVTITLQSGTGTIGTVINNGNGTYTATVTAPTLVGSGVFVATINGNPIESGGTTQTQSTVTYTPGSANKLAFSQQPSGAPLGVAFTTQPQVTVQDTYGNKVTSSGAPITIAIGTNPGGGTLNGTKTINASSGVATFTGISISKTGVGYTLVASATGLTSITSNPFNITAGTVSATVSTVTANPTAVTANGTSTSTITVTLLDAGSNPASGKTVTLTQGTGNSTISVASGASDSSGVVTFTVTDTTIQSVTYTAKDTTDNITIAQTASVNFTGPGNAGTSTVVASPTSVTANGTTTSTITVTLKDVNSTPVSGKTVTLAKTSGPGTPTITTVSGTTNSSGVATFTVKSTTSGADVFTATDTSDSVTITQTATVTFTAGTATQVKVETAADGSGTVVGSQSLASGNTLTVYAITRDAQGNFVANATATWSFNSKTGGVANGDLTPTSGTSATFAGHLVGTGIIHAVISGLTSTDSGTITVTAGTATQVKVETLANGTGTVVGSQSITAGNTLTVYAITRDVQGNFVANATATWSFTSKTGGVANTDLSPASGTSTVMTGHLVGTGIIRAVISGLTSTDSGTITVTAGTATQVQC